MSNTIISPDQFNNMNTSIQSPAIRESQVSAAITFLNNDKVKLSPISKRVQFLESKGLTNYEICDALRRINPSSAEYLLLQQKLNEHSGIKASDAVVSLDSSSTTPTIPIQSTTTSSTNYPVAQSSNIPHSTNTQQPVLYAHTDSTGRTYYSTTPSAPIQSQSTWLATTAAVTGIASAGAGLYYMWNKYMPSIKFESKHNDNENIIQNNEQLKQLIDHKHSGTHTINDNKSLTDKFNLSYLNDNSNTSNTNDDTYKAVTSLKNDFRDIVDLLREQTTDIKRALNTIQLSIEVVNRRNKDDKLNSCELNDTLQAIQKLISKQQNNSNNELMNGINKHNTAVDKIASSWISTDNTIDTYPPRSTISNTSIHDDIDKSSDLSDSKSSISDTESAEQHIESGDKAVNHTLDLMKSDNTSSDIKMSLQAMSLYIGNILSHMSETKYRKIMLSNSTYNTRVRRVKHAEQLLLSAGFMINGSYIEWNDMNGKQLWKHTLLQNTLDKLNQCMIT